MIEIVKVLEMKPIGTRSLWLRFSDGQEGVRDCADILAEGGPMVEPLCDPAPELTEWLQLDPINLHEEMRAAGTLHGASAA